MSTIDDTTTAKSALEANAAPGTGDALADRVRFDAFVSYRRLPGDTAFVDWLQEALAARGKQVWVDRTDIEPAADWSERILRGIQAAKSFIFIVTPESVVSEECRRELDIAVQNHKLVIPLVVRETERRDLPESLTRPNWILFEPGKDPERGLDSVIRALEEDLGWRDAHTRLGVRAKEWSDAHRDGSFLLRGSDLRSAEEWLSEAGEHEKTPPTAVQTEYILASRKATTRTQRTWRAALTGGLVIALALAAVAFLQRQQAVHQRDIAISRQLINQSETLGDTDPAISKLESLAAWGLNPTKDSRHAMLDAAARPGIDALATSSGLHAVAFSPDGTTLAAGSGDHAIRLWDAATRRQIAPPLTGHTDLVVSVAFSPRGETLASGSFDGTVRLWDLASHRQIGSPLTGHDDNVLSIAFSPDGRTLASGGADGSARLWDVGTHRQIGYPLYEGTSGITSVAFSPDGKTLAGGSDNGAVGLWDVATQRPIGSLLAGYTGHVNSVAFSPDRKTLASATDGGVVRLWNVATRQPIGNPLTGGTDVINSVTFSPDGKTLASGGGDGMVWLWDAAARRQIGTPLAGHAGAVYSVAFSPDGRTVASGGADRTVRLWNAAGVVGLATLTGHTERVVTAGFAPNGKTLATGSNDGTVRLWDTVTHRQIGSPMIGARVGNLSVSFSPDGKTVASGGADGVVRLWNVATHHQMWNSLAADHGLVESVAFSPDGRTLASGHGDGTVLLWDVTKQQRIEPDLVGSKTEAVNAIAFSPDGATLASGNVDMETVDSYIVRMWNVNTHHQLRALRAPSGGPVHTVLCSAPTARRWPAAAPTAPYGCGTGPISPLARPLPATPAASIQLRSARTAVRFPAPLTTRRSGCGT
jgi:WD40 repeat protein